MTRPAAPLLLLACLAFGCQERAASVSEGEPAADGSTIDAAADGAPPDAGPTPDPDPTPEPDPDPTPDPDPDPTCAYTPEPLAACTAPAEPAADCTARIDGDRRFVATFADGRQTSLLDGDGSGFVAAFDDQPSSRIDTVEAGCVQRRRDEERVGERTLEARVDRGGATCLLETRRDGDLLEQREDVGCDCRDLVVRQACEYGPRGPVACIWLDRDGAPSTRRLWGYDDDGDTLEVQRHRGGEVVSVERTTYDSERRVVEVVILSMEPGRAPVVQHRTTITYTEDPRQTTERQDAGDDGRAEVVRRTTWDGGRVIRFEEGDEDGFTTVVETAWRDDGYDRTTTVDGEVTRSERLLRGADGVVTTTVTTAERTETETVTGDAEGRLIERVIERVPGGTFTERLAWDDAGRLRSEHITFTGEPAFDCALTYEWDGDCPGPAGRFNDACAFELPP